MTKAQAELISAAREFMIDVFAKAPEEALQGMTPQSIFERLMDLTPGMAEAQIKAAPDGAASVRLAQAIKAASAAEGLCAENFVIRESDVEAMMAAFRDKLCEGRVQMEFGPRSIGAMRHAVESVGGRVVEGKGKPKAPGLVDAGGRL